MEGTPLMHILYEDNHILVVLKPRGVLSQADGSEKEDMLTLLKEYVKEKYHKPGNVYLGLVHRLDRNTSGVMVFAKTSKAAARLSKQIQEHTFKKYYKAIVEGYIEGEKRLEGYFLKNEREKKSHPSPKGQYASLYYEAIGHKTIQNQMVTLVQIELETGRFHQIRVQFSSIGHPLYGDMKYGSKHKIDPLEFPLEAYKVEFFHPITNEKLQFEYNTLHL